MTLEKTIKTAVKEEKIIIGARQVMKALKKSKIKHVVHAQNCPGPTLKDLEHYSGVSKIGIEKFNGNSEMLGQICGKPFRISLLGIRD